MIDTLSIYNHLRRPALLFKAAQIALKIIAVILNCRSYWATRILYQRGADYHISAHLDVLIAMTAKAQSLTAAITPKNQEQLLSCAQYTRQEPRLSPDQAVVFDSWPSDTRPEHWPRS